VQIFAGLLAGLLLGLGASAQGPGALMDFATGVEPVGTIWMNLLRMCVVPLVVSAIVSGVGSLGDLRRLGRVGARTLGFVSVTIVLGSLFGLVVALFLVQLAPVSAQAAAHLRETAAASAAQITQQTQQVQGLKQFLLDLVPANAVRAAADGALLPLVVFSVLIGAAVGGLVDAQRKAVLGLSDALVSALIRLITWIMILAPIGVACLAAPIAARLGWESLRNLAMFVVSVVVAITLYAITVFPAAVKWLVRVPVGRFARTITPGVTVGFTTASSMAALPAMMDTALADLKISKPVASFVLPLTATVNRPGGAIYQATAVVFMGSLYGVHLGPAQYLAAIATSFLMTLSTPGIPSATVLTAAPVMSAAGLPVESIGLLLGVDRIPDMFRTGLHTMFHQTAAAVVARAEGEEIVV
jgi:Na+/H+-dicarboxylate symporter